MVTTDLESIDCICRSISVLGEKLTGGGNLLRRPLTLVQSQHFVAEVFLIPDYDRADGGLAIQIRLRRRGPGNHRDRDLYVYFGTAVRRLDRPKAWRKAARSQARKHRALLLSIDLGREIYWTKEVPPEDLKAQIITDLIQLGCLSSDSAELKDWLTAYICRTYKFRIERQLPRSELAQARKAIAIFAVESINRNWAFPEHHRAFRMYIKQVLRGARREYLGPSELGTDVRQHFKPDYDRHDREDNAEPFWDPRMDTDNGPWSYAQSDVPVAVRPVLKDEMSVVDAAAYLKLSQSYVHRLVRQGRLQHIRGKAVITLAKDEVERVRAVLTSRHSLRAKRENLERAGKTRDASRKSIYRTLGPRLKI